MTYDSRLIPFTGTHEGTVLKAYRDPTGNITIGNGFTWGSKIFRDYWMKSRGHKLRMSDRITKEESSDLLHRLINAEYAPPALSKFAGRTPHAKAAGIDMTFNAGLGALKWTWATFLADGNVPRAAKRFETTATTSRGRELPGLVRRRAEGAAIMENDDWPAWVGSARKPAAPETVPWRLNVEDMRAAQKLLIDQGYGPVVMTGVQDDKTARATRRFQIKHPQLDNDGIMGRATYAALQRVRNLKQESAGTTATGGGTAVTGVSEITPYADWFLYGGLTLLVVAGAYLAWTYRDELKLLLRKV